MSPPETPNPAIAFGWPRYSDWEHALAPAPPRPSRARQASEPDPSPRSEPKKTSFERETWIAGSPSALVARPVAPTVAACGCPIEKVAAAATPGTARIAVSASSTKDRIVGLIRTTTARSAGPGGACRRGVSVRTRKTGSMLPFVDEHTTDVAAPRATTWIALERHVQRLVSARSDRLRRLLGTDPPAGFAVAESVAQQRIELAGRHRFSRYRLEFELTDAQPGG